MRHNALINATHLPPFSGFRLMWSHPMLTRDKTLAPSLYGSRTYMKNLCVAQYAIHSPPKWNTKRMMDFRSFLSREPTVHFSIRLRTALKISPKEQQLSKWLQEMQTLGIVPDEILGGQLVSMCKTQADFVELKSSLTNKIWNSPGVFTNRILTSKRIAVGEQNLHQWLQEIRADHIRVDEVAGNVLVSLCKTPEDLGNLKNTLPIRIWNTADVFTNRILVSNRMPGSEHDLSWWLHEMQSCNVQPNDVTGNVLLSLCKSSEELYALRKVLPSVIWNSTRVFTNRISLSLRISGAKQSVSWWLREMQACTVRPDEITGTQLVSLCDSQEDLDILKKCLSDALWNSAIVFANRVAVSTRIHGEKLDVAWWLCELRSHKIILDEITATKLASLCRTQEQLDELESALSVAIWNSTNVFNSRIVASMRMRSGVANLKRWLREMHSHNIAPNEITGNVLVSLCKGQEDLAHLQQLLPSAIWNNVGVFNNRIVVSMRLSDGQHELEWWLREMRSCNVLPNEITGTQLVCSCETQMDLRELQKVLPVSIWNSTGVFTNRMVVSKKMKDQRDVRWWLQEMQAHNILPNDITGNVFVSLCKTQGDLEELQKVLPAVIWNSAVVFNNRIAHSSVVPCSQRGLKWWLREMLSSNVRPDEITATQLVSLCTSEAELSELKEALPSDVWNSTGVFTNRIEVAKRIPGAEQELTQWLREMNLCGVQPNEILGTQLVSVCKSQFDLKILQRRLPSHLWHSTGVFCNRVIVSKRIPEAGQDLGCWLCEMHSWNIEPNEIVGNVFVSLCNTHRDLEALQKALPHSVWNSSGVFTNRIIVARRIPGCKMDVGWWLREMRLCNIQATEHSAVQLVGSCRTEAHLLEVKKHLPPSVWNHPEVFNKRVNVCSYTLCWKKPVSFWLAELQDGEVAPNEVTGRLLLSLCRSLHDLVRLKKHFPAVVPDNSLLENLGSDGSTVWSNNEAFVGLLNIR